MRRRGFFFQPANAWAHRPGPYAPARPGENTPKSPNASQCLSCCNIIVLSRAVSSVWCVLNIHCVHNNRTPKTISNRAHPNRTPIPGFRSPTANESRTHTSASPTAHAKNPHLLPLLPRSADRSSPASHPSPTALPGGARPRMWLPPVRRASRQRPAVLPTRSLSHQHSSPPTPLPCRPPSPVEPLASGKHRRGGLSSPRRPLLCVPPPKPASRLLLPTPPDTLRPSATSPRWPSHRRTAASPRTTPRGPDGGLRTTARAAPTATGALELDLARAAACSKCRRLLGAVPH